MFFFVFVLIEGEATLQIYDLKSAICNRSTAVSLEDEKKKVKFILPFSTLFYFPLIKYFFSLSIACNLETR
jgi:hypothetical protein